jgi:hypothetical protein
MESFHVNLANYRLPFLMPAMFEGRLLNGTMRLERGAQVRTFSFRDGCLVAASSSEPAEHLAQMLSDLGILNAELAVSAFEAACAANQPYGELLVERDFVDEARLLGVLEHKARESFFDCYTWEAGELLFTGEAPEVRGVELEIQVGPLHRDALASLREWKSFREAFPDPGITFDVFRECLVDWGTRSEEALLELAEEGATLGELLASSREGTLPISRRIVNLCGRGALAPKSQRGDQLGTSAELEELLRLARSAFDAQQFEQAVELAVQVLQRAPVAEAHALCRKAEQQLALAIADKEVFLEGRLAFATLPHPAPAHLMADDLYLYGKLKGARSVRAALAEAPMGELAAWRSLGRLRDAGLVWETDAPSTLKRRRTDPQWGC